MGSALAVICGLALWIMPVGEKWSEASYDYLFRFGTRTVTNQIVVILMDNDAYAELGQTREQPWDRSLHAKLLNKLADDGCRMVVFDVFFRRQGDVEEDKALAAAMRRFRDAVLTAEQANVAHPGLDAAQPTLPLETFLNATHTNWGVAWLNPDMDMIVRRHWPFPNPGPYPSLPWTAASLSGARLSEMPAERWLRYYDFNKAWPSLSYNLALGKGPNYFRDKIVFIGSKPRTSLPDGEADKFQTPYTSWTGEAVGGVEILVTSYLNLVNSDWLRRLAWPVEGLLLIVTGAVLGGTLPRFSRGKAFGLALCAALAFTIVGVCLSCFTNFWFPWLIVVYGQVPSALAWAMAMPLTSSNRQSERVGLGRFGLRAMRSVSGRRSRRYISQNSATIGTRMRPSSRGFRNTSPFPKSIPVCCA